MKKLVLLLLLFVCKNLCAQRLSGTVTDCKYARPIEKMAVRVFGSDGSTVDAVTDSAGHYSVSLKPGYDYIASCIGGEARGPHGTGNYNALPDKNKSLFSTKRGSDGQVKAVFVFDFCLEEKITGCGLRFPVFTFTKNSTVPLPDTSFTHDGIDPVVFLAQVMKDNPSMVVELGGHADSSETQPVALSLKRAQVVADTLFKHGIAKGRIVTKGYGAVRPLKMPDGTMLTQRYIRSRPKTEQDGLHMLNTRVVFRVISWDYVPEKSGN